MSNHTYFLSYNSGCKDIVDRQLSIPNLVTSSDSSSFSNSSSSEVGSCSKLSDDLSNVSQSSFPGFEDSSETSYTRSICNVNVSIASANSYKSVCIGLCCGCHFEARVESEIEFDQLDKVHFEIGSQSSVTEISEVLPQY